MFAQEYEMNHYVDCTLKDGSQERMELRQLTDQDVAEAARLCDRCVGKNLYSRDYLTAIVHDPRHFFYLLFSGENTPVGYMYFILMDRAELASISKLDAAQLDKICDEPDICIGNLRSIGLDEPYRSIGLSAELIRFSFAQLISLGAHLAVGLCWKPGQVVPMKKTMEICGMQYLTDAHRVWYDIHDLECPYCSGRCECDAAVYYKRLEDAQ
ncbi:MAG: hypothetical protein LUG58_05095 [Clostridiales bacterium]|nr:hypothetical protein [Clostridiales bacterium]